MNNNVFNWKSDFNFSDDHLRELFLLLHSFVLESHVEAFQYKMLSNILYTNNRTDNFRCTFCEAKLA